MAGLNGSLQPNSQFPGADPRKRSLLQLTTETFYQANLTPPRKQVKFQGSSAATPTRRKEYSVLTQSVPDFSSALRKENRRPTTMLLPLTEKSMTTTDWFKELKNVRNCGQIGRSKSERAMLIMWKN